MSDLSKRLREMAESTVLCEDEYADLIAAAEALEAAEWRDISEANDDDRLEFVGKRNSVGVWLIGRNWLARDAKYYRYTHFIPNRPLPAPPTERGKG